MSVLDSLIATASKILETPEEFLLQQENVYNESKEKAKELYDFCLQQMESDSRTEIPLDVMQELLIDEFDDEQIWQELELFNRQREKEGIEGVGEVVSMEVDLGEDEEEERQIDG